MMSLRSLWTAAAAAILLALGTAGSAAAATDPWTLPDQLIRTIEGDWATGNGVYLDRGRISIRANAMLLELHALAALAGHDGPARQDDRMAALVRFFTRPPVVVYKNTKKRVTGHFPHVPAWESEYTANSQNATLHPSADAVIARSLATAWRAREVAALPLADSQAIETIVGAVAGGPFYLAPNRAENQINWNASVYEANLEVNGDRSRLPDYRAHLMWFVDHAHKRAYKGGSSNLSRGKGFRYLPRRDGYAANGIDTVEYANLVHSSLGFYNAAVRAGMRPLPGKRIDGLKNWSRHVLFGTWTHAGYLNWDTGLGRQRRHLMQYWAYALDALVRSSGPGALIGTAGQRAYVRELAEQGLRLFALQGWNGTGPLPPATMFTAPNGFAQGTRSPLVTPLRFAVISALLDSALPAVAPRAMGNVYSHDSEFGRLAVSTPSYNTAVIQPAGQDQGGIEPVRLFNGQQRPLMVLNASSFRGAAPGVRLTRNGKTIADSQPGAQERAGKVPPISVAKARRNRSGEFVQLNAEASVRTANSTITAKHNFTSEAIATEYRIRRGGADSITLRLPVWGRGSKIEFLRGVTVSGSQLLRRGEGPILVRCTTTDGAVMFASFRKVPADAVIAVLGREADGSSPQGARELRIRFRTKEKIVELGRRIAVVHEALPR